MPSNIEKKTRFVATAQVLRLMAWPKARVLEIGATDATFQHSVSVKEWLTIDKFGKPDYQMDLDDPNVQLPFCDCSIDLIVCTEVLEHLAAGSKLVEEIARVLTMDGKALISVPNVASLKSRLKVICGLLPNMAASGDCGPPLGGTGFMQAGRWVGGHLVDFNVKRLELYLERGGLRLVKHWPIPVSVRFGKNRELVIPKQFFPKTFADFILFEMEKQPE